MKAYTYSDARKHLSKVLDIARTEEVIIKRRSGEVFSVVPMISTKSPFAIPGSPTHATTTALVAGVGDSRSTWGGGN